MDDSLSKQYLLYLRDMSRKVVYGASGSAGDYSQVLIRGSKQKNARKFPRMTDIKLDKLINNPEGYRRQQDQENIGNGIFCGVGIVAGTFSKKVRGVKSLRLISAPAIYGQLIFEEEEEGESEISEWIVNNPYYMETEKGQQEYVQMVKNITQDISGCEKDIQPTIKNICKETLVE